MKNKTVKKSYGIICGRVGSDGIELAMMARNHTYSFQELILYKQSISRDNVAKLLNKMTIREKIELINRSYDDIYNTVRVTKYAPNKVYISSKRKFEIIKNKYDLKSMISQSKHGDQIWDFPKGKKEKHESDIECAVREFIEETGIKRGDIKVIPEIVFNTRFIDSGVIYHYKLYLAFASDSARFMLNTRNYDQIDEIGDLRWLNLKTIIAMNIGPRITDLSRKSVYKLKQWLSGNLRVNRRHKQRDQNRVDRVKCMSLYSVNTERVDGVNVID